MPPRSPSACVLTHAPSSVPHPNRKYVLPPMYYCTIALLGSWWQFNSREFDYLRLHSFKSQVTFHLFRGDLVTGFSPTIGAIDVLISQIPNLPHIYTDLEDRLGHKIDKFMKPGEHRWLYVTPWLVCLVKLQTLLVKLIPNCTASHGTTEYDLPL